MNKTEEILKNLSDLDEYIAKYVCNTCLIVTLHWIYKLLQKEEYVANLQGVQFGFM